MIKILSHHQSSLIQMIGHSNHNSTAGISSNIFLSSGDLRDDTKPAFVREYQQALTVVCDSLFFAHHNRPSDTLQSVASVMGTDAGTAGQALQNLFGQSPTEDARTRVVEDLLDVKVLPEVDAHGRQFNAERVQER